MKMDFTKIEDIDDFSVIPKGKYKSECIDIIDIKGKDSWMLKFAIREGVNLGKSLIDFIGFNDNEFSKKRLKMYFCRLGKLPKDYNGEITKDILIGKQCILDVGTEIDKDAEMNEDGSYPLRNKIAFAGCIEIKESEKKEEVTHEDDPFN